MFEEYNIKMATGQSETDEALMIQDAVSCLPDDKKAVVALVVAGFRQHEVSKILQVSRTTVWAKKKDALELLKKFLEGDITCPDMGNI